MRLLFCLLLVGCVHTSPEEEAKLAVKRANNALVVEEYRQRLLECKSQGKDAGSFSVFERCAREADIKYGFDQHVDGGP